MTMSFNTKKTRMRFISSLWLVFFLTISAILFPYQQSTQPEIIWKSCALGRGIDEKIAECVVIPLPLHYDDPNSPLISVAVKRKLGRSPHRRQVWFLDGGPGDSGTESLAGLVKVFGDIDDIDFYTFDHRGVGGTALLECPDQQSPQSEDGREIVESEWANCIKYLRENRNDLDALTTANSARDLGRLVEIFREPRVPVYILGVSYGTYLANRYLQLYPNQPDGVILDGLVPADWSFAEFDFSLDQAARKFLAKCSEHPDCLSHLGSKPKAFLENLLEKIGTGACKNLGLKPGILKLILGNMLMIESLRPYIPALIERCDRCNWYDKMAILQFFRKLTGDEKFISEPKSHSQVLQRHIALSELWNENDKTQKELKDDISKYIMTTNVSASFAETYHQWPKYDPEPYDDRFADYEGPLLMLHGGMDPTMPLARLDEMRSHFSNAFQYFIFVPEGYHVVLNEGECIRSIYLSFLNDPTHHPETSCISSIHFRSFDWDEKISKSLFGSAQPWGDHIPWNLRLLKCIYHVPWLIIAIAFVITASIRIRMIIKNIDVSTPYFRLFLAGIAWILISMIFRQAALLLPFLFNYRAIHTLGLVFLCGLIQIGVGILLFRWLRRGYDQNLFKSSS